jgi:CheY-like chemotaxis protein
MLSPAPKDSRRAAAGTLIAQHKGVDRIKRILILDNDPKALQVLGQLLELHCQHVQVCIAYTALSAVHSASTGDFDVVIVDLHLDEGENEGVNVASALYSRCDTALPTLIVVSSDRVGIAAERSASLFDHALDKPLVIKELFEIIRSV